MRGRWGSTAVLFVCAAIIGVCWSQTCLPELRNLASRDTGLFATYQGKRAGTWPTELRESTCHQSARLVWATYTGFTAGRDWNNMIGGFQFNTANNDAMVAAPGSLQTLLTTSLATTPAAIVVRVSALGDHHFVIVAKSGREWMLLQSWVDNYVLNDWMWPAAGRAGLPHKDIFDRAHDLWGGGRYFDPNEAKDVTLGGHAQQKSFLQLIDCIDRTHSGALGSRPKAAQKDCEHLVFGTPASNSKTVLGVTSMSTRLAARFNELCPTNAGAIMTQLGTTGTAPCRLCLRLVAAVVARNQGNYNNEVAIDQTMSYGVVAALATANGFSYAQWPDNWFSGWKTTHSAQYRSPKGLCETVRKCASTVVDASTFNAPVVAAVASRMGDLFSRFKTTPKKVDDQTNTDGPRRALSNKRRRLQP
jgi:hypothetical protein